VATFQRIEMINASTFIPSPVINHNDLSSIQGGTTAEYYHLTSAEYTYLGAHKDRHDPDDGADALDTANAAEISVVVAAGTGTSHSFARADHVHAITHAITDNHIVTIDGTANQNEHAVFGAGGIAGLTDTELIAALSGDAGAAFSWNSQNLTSVGTIGCGNITGGTYNALTLTAAATGFTIAGGTTPKTLTVDDAFVVSTQLAAIGVNTAKITCNFTNVNAALAAADATININDQQISNIKSLAFNDGGATCTQVKDENDMASNSQTMLATQASIKAYADSVAGGASFATAAALGTL